MTSDTQLALQAALNRVSIREPFRTLLNPSFRLGANTRDGGGELIVVIDTFEAETGAPMRAWSNSFPFSMYMAGRFGRDPLKLAIFCLDSLMQHLRHEGQESLLLDGDLAVPPIHNKVSI